MRPQAVQPRVTLRLVALATDDALPVAGRLVLTAEQRAKTRFRALLSDGRDALVMLPRGTPLRPGTRLASDDGELVEVVGAPEPVYRVTPQAGRPDPAFDLLRATYHLGNRHVPVELGVGFVRLERDPVLRDMLLRLDVAVTAAFEPFDPEPGAYGGGHRHGAVGSADADDGAIGEQLSRDAHAAASPGAEPAP